MTRLGEILGIIVWGWHLGHFHCYECYFIFDLYVLWSCGEMVNNF
jgi:hypothetical protein